MDMHIYETVIPGFYLWELVFAGVMNKYTYYRTAYCVGIRVKMGKGGREGTGSPNVWSGEA